MTGPRPRLIVLYALGLEEQIEHLIRSAGVEVVVDTLSRHPGSSWWWMAEEEREESHQCGAP
jgi:hypothetical protein